MKRRVKTWQVRGIWSQQLKHKQVPKRGTEPGVRKGKCPLLASHTRCNCSMETTHNSVKVKFGIEVMKLVESLIGWEVTVGQGPECHLTFVRGKIEKVPRGIRGEKSSKDMASSRNLVSTIGALASPKMGTEPGVRKGKRSLLACHTRCKCSMETTHNQ